MSGKTHHHRKLAINIDQPLHMQLSLINKKQLIQIRISKRIQRRKQINNKY